jgi:hypothetical protein
MPQRRRDLLDILRFELDFLERGGYGSAATPWRPQSIFRDSLTCLNFNCGPQQLASLGVSQAAGTQKPRPCNECELYEFVPPPHRSETMPCHYIPLNDAGQCLATLDRGRNQQELQQAVIGWLRRTIAQLEGERRHPPRAG